MNMREAKLSPVKAGSRVFPAHGWLRDLKLYSSLPILETSPPLPPSRLRWHHPSLSQSPFGPCSYPLVSAPSLSSSLPVLLPPHFHEPPDSGRRVGWQALRHLSCAGSFKAEPKRMSTSRGVRAGAPTRTPSRRTSGVEATCRRGRYPGAGDWNRTGKLDGVGRWCP